MSSYKILYGYTDEDGGQNWEETGADSPIHAADILYNLRPERWEVTTTDIRGRQKDVTLNVHHILVRYVAPAYLDGREYSPLSHRELKKVV